MALLGSATWNPAGATPGGYMDPRVVIFHVIDGEGNARPHDGLEWHFEVSYSGAIEQGVDTNRQAAANYHANPFAISVETEGLAAGLWTDAQLDSLVLLSEWCMAEHPLILRQRCPRWDGSGFGHHTMFGAPGPWTPVAKSCPGANRKRQFDEVLLPRILNGPQEGDDMTPDQATQLARVEAIADENRWNASRLDGIDARLQIIAKQVGAADFDEAEVARLVLSGIGDAALSDEQVAALVDALPKAVADELARRAQA